MRLLSDGDAVAMLAEHVPAMRFRAMPELRYDGVHAIGVSEEGAHAWLEFTDHANLIFEDGRDRPSRYLVGPVEMHNTDPERAVMRAIRGLTACLN